MHYFAIKDSIESGEIKTHHVGTDDMIGDFFAKSLQGGKFKDFRNLILGLKNEL